MPDSTQSPWQARVEDRLGSLQTQVAELRGRFENSVATREWVRDEMRPMRESQLRQEEILASIAKSVERTEATQDDIMRQRAQNEAEAHRAALVALEERKNAEIATLKQNAILTRVKEIWTPWLGFLGVLYATFAIFGEGIKAWLKAHGF